MSVQRTAKRWSRRLGQILLTDMKPESDLTAFQRRVFQVLATIPAGKVTSYASVARHLGMGSARAIGQALKENPHAPEVPCHRVIRADGSLGGDMGETNGPCAQRKRQLLQREGVHFNEHGKLASDEYWFAFSCNPSCGGDRL